MAARLLLVSLSFGCLGLLGQGVVPGGMGGPWWLFLLAGAGVGGLIGWRTRKVELAKETSRRLARICFAAALLFLVWGLVGISLGRDPVSGASLEGSPVMFPLLFLLASAVPASLGFYLLAMRTS